MYTVHTYNTAAVVRFGLLKFNGHALCACVAHHTALSGGGLNVPSSAVGFDVLTCTCSSVSWLKMVFIVEARSMLEEFGFATGVASGDVLYDAAICI